MVIITIVSSIFKEEVQMIYLLIVGLPIMAYLFFWGMLEVIYLFFHGPGDDAFSLRMLKIIIPAIIAMAVFRGVLTRQTHR
jgi:hypothetical protein